MAKAIYDTPLPWKEGATNKQNHLSFHVKNSSRTFHGNLTSQILSTLKKETNFGPYLWAIQADTGTEWANK